MESEYWKWPEFTWRSENSAWANADGHVVGVDIGTTSAQAVILLDGKLCSAASVRVGADFKKAAASALENALAGSGLAADRIRAIGATGFGKQNVTNATAFFDEVLCTAKGARFLFGPTVRTVVDLGGQTTKAIRLHGWDRVRDFMMNDKCATGFGRNIEEMAELLQVPITEMGEKSLDVAIDPEPVSTTCYSFANPETIGLFRTGFREEPSSENEVIAAHLFAIAWRILGVIGKLAPLDVGEITAEADIAFTGGLAKNVGITSRIERQLKMKALTSEYDPQLAGAIGAALLL
ncbi:MAG: acyl-CoA dehydratase activase [Clostridiales Family XIII bacterium]|jgi:predicted CoA-substrate-specific enzyme activase|nr:acyl-CoA dehydratase activase [Clostridiales Family XIII bacterium]